MGTSLTDIAEPFIAMAHRIVWCSAATVDTRGRPRSRVLHPLWEWDGQRLVGWIATSPQSLKAKHLEGTPQLSCNYWAANHDTCVAECDTSWHNDAATREAVWQKFVTAPDPVGYDPSIIPGWDSPASEGFGVLRLEPWFLRVMPGSVLLTGGQEGETLVWSP